MAVKEKLQEYALLAEIFSAIAVVLSLIFVGLQIRQGAEETAANTAAIRSSVQLAMMEADKDLLLFQSQKMQNERLALGDDFVEPGFNEYQTYSGAFIRTRQHYWSQHQAGLLDDETYYSYMSSFIRGHLANNIDARKMFINESENRSLPQGFVDEVYHLWAESYPDRFLNPGFNAETNALLEK